MATLELHIVTPESEVFKGQVPAVTLPGSEGEFMVYPNHAPLLTALVPGELRYSEGGRVHSLAIAEGFAEVSGSYVHVMTEIAVEDSDIDERSVQEAIARAEQALREKSLVGEELEALEAGLARNIAQLKLKRRQR